MENYNEKLNILFEKWEAKSIENSEEKAFCRDGERRPWGMGRVWGLHRIRPASRCGCRAQELHATVVLRSAARHRGTEGY